MSKEFKKKPFDELSITDNYMFQAVMRDPKLVKPLLEMLLNLNIPKCWMKQLKRLNKMRKGELST